MSCCSADGADKFFSKQAKRYAKKFRKKGLDKASQHIVEGLIKLGVDSKSLLEIGCGVGGLHLTLLKQGAASAQGVEVSKGMLGAAKTIASEMGLAEKVTYHCGDFVELNGDISQADIVVMDKVICCTTDPVRLIQKSAVYTKSVLAVSYPRKSLLAKVVFAVPSKLGELLRWSFRPYYHHPTLIEKIIEGFGFSDVFSSTTIIWQIRIYQKQ
jgi:magnesium-protoporphyrin O-methyltransferase